MIVINHKRKLNHPVEDGSNLIFDGPDVFTREQVEDFKARAKAGETINFDDELAKIKKAEEGK